jgi:hypothetical protein
MARHRPERRGHAALRPCETSLRRADRAIEQIDGLVGQIGDQVKRNGDQGRVTTLKFVAGEMLCRSTAGLAASWTGLLFARSSYSLDNGWMEPAMRLALDAVLR